MHEVDAMNSREIIRVLIADGWQEVKKSSGTSHRQFKHPTKPGKVTVKHPAADFPIGTIKSIERQAGLKLR
jgi:predicted RNA binding protein YcfA (HicA-like mRNA interferase family)